MAYEFEGWTLYARTVKARSGRRKVEYFFSLRKPKTGGKVDLPPGYEVAINRRTGLPYLKKGARRLTKEEFDERIRRQEGVCAICNKPSKGSLVIDHSHKTGTVRGLLCGPCNIGLGMFQDSPRLLLKAAQYLEKAAGSRSGMT